MHYNFTKALAIIGRGFVAQLAEQLPLKQLVVGSSPTEPTK